MSTITTIQSSDLITNSRSVLNTNFSNLNTDKMETSVLDTDTSLAGNSDSRVATQKAVKTYIDTGGQPNGFTGIITPYGGSVAPTGWLLCNGAAVSRSTYANLFAVCSTTFGSGDGSTTFNLPNLQNRVPVGVGSATKVATFSSRSSNVITVTGLTNTANNEFQTGRTVVYHTTGSVMTGLTNDTTYYVVSTGNLTFSLATTLANAQNAVVISLSSDGSGTQTFTHTFATRTLADTGGEDNHAMSATEVLAHTHTALGQTTSTLYGGGGNSAVVTTSGNTGSFGGNVTMNNMQPYLALYYIIKT